MKRLFPFVVILFFVGGCLWAQEELTPTRIALRELAGKAEAGDPKSLYDLAKLHDTGYDSIPKDSVRSTAMYLKSAEKGYAPAMNFIGFRYYNGEIVNKDLDSAVYWIRRAAEDGDITAAANLGYLLLDSPEIEHDTVEASKWLMVAAEEGVVGPQHRLIEINKVEWDELPADSALNLGLKYYLGKAPVLGFNFIKIATKGAIPRAYALLGDAYSRGIGVPYDHQKSVDNFFKAAMMGDPSAQFIIAELLDFFPDADQSSQGAAYWHEKAESQGISDSESAYSRLFTLP